MSKARILLVEDSEAQTGIDTFGHKAGDLVLIEIANIIKENVRDVDTVGRWGGEEFIAALPFSNKDQGLKKKNL